METERERILALFRDPDTESELDDEDWASLRVAIRLVLETEVLRTQLQQPESPDSKRALSVWMEALENGIAFMSWVRCLATIATDAERVPFPSEGRVDDLWAAHGDYARRLSEAPMTPGQRISLLTALGGLELAILGHLWWRGYD